MDAAGNNNSESESESACSNILTVQMTIRRVKIGPKKNVKKKKFKQ